MHASRSRKLCCNALEMKNFRCVHWICLLLSWLICLWNKVRKAALHSVNVVCVSPTCSEILQDGNPDALIHVSQLLCSLFCVQSFSCLLIFDVLSQNPFLKDSTDLILERIKDDSKQRHFLLKTVGHCPFPSDLCRPELIREVDLGPFKHKVRWLQGIPRICCFVYLWTFEVDDGLPLRKFAYTADASIVKRYSSIVVTSSAVHRA